MISNKLHRAIQELASVSSTAQAVSDRLRRTLLAPMSVSTSNGGSGSTSNDSTTNSSSSTIEELTSNVTRLTSLVEQLKDIIEDEVDAKYTDAQAAEFTKNLTTSLKELQPYSIISVYNEEYFRAYPKNVRVLIAQTLISYFDTLKNDAPALWHSISSSNGFMKLDSKI